MLNISQVETFGQTLLEQGKNEDIIVVDLDVADSTKTDYFSDAYSDRFIQVGISEQDGIGIAAGLAMSGKTPVISGFAYFLAGRAWEQISNTVAREKLNVKIVATHSGLSPFADGGSHQMLADIAIMRVVPGMTVLVPADAPSTRTLFSQALDYRGPIYLRLVRGAPPILYEGTPELEIGEAYTIREGADVTIAGAGVPLNFALEAARELEGRGIEARVMDLHTVKPLDEGSLVKAARETGAFVTVEEHSVLGGVGGAVSEVLSENYPVPLRRVGVKDLFGESSRNLQSLYDKHRLTADGVVEAVIKVMERR